MRAKVFVIGRGQSSIFVPIVQMNWKVMKRSVFSKLWFCFAFALIVNTTQAQTIWPGEYFYAEVGGETAGGTKIYVAHTIRVKEEDGKLNAHLYSQGFQTSRDIFADCVADQDSLALYFREKGPDDVFGDFEPGDHLLTIAQNAVRLETSWGKFLPVLDDNLENGQVRFVRVVDEKTNRLQLKPDSGNFMFGSSGDGTRLDSHSPFVSSVLKSRFWPSQTNSAAGTTFIKS